MKRGLIICSIVFILIIGNLGLVSAGWWGDFTNWFKDLFEIGEKGKLGGELASMGPLGTIECIENDGGENEFVKGVLDYGDTNNEDWCYEGISKVREYYCTGSGSIGSTAITCDLGCSNGACISEGGCVESWTCTTWSICISDQQTRTCTDTNNCGATIYKPIENRACESCIENWFCGDWSDCVDGQQTRGCIDTNHCGTTDNKPDETQDCGAECIEDWSCGSWSTCSAGTQTRTCIDSNNCGTTENKPSETQSCTCISNWSCSNWGDCRIDETQERICNDLNNCEAPKIETQNCTLDTCTENWDCGEWGTFCWPDDNVIRRHCTDLNHCGTTENKPSETKLCDSDFDDDDKGPKTCTEDWSCTSWSNCLNSQQTRTCIDKNGCGVVTNKPIISQECSVYIASKKINLNKNEEGKNLIETEENTVKTSLEITANSEKIYIKSSSGNKEIKILPEEAISKDKKIDEISSLIIEEEEGIIIYSIVGTTKARLFFIFPIQADITKKVSIETGEIISIKRPWWHLFAWGV